MRSVRQQSRRGTAYRVGVAMTALLLVTGACSSDRSDEDPNEDESSAAASTELPTDTFGDLESPCGDGDASGATDQGVTDDSITIGFGDDKGFSLAPGLNQEMGDTMEAAIAWCNGLGGINGREIVGNRYDAALNNAAQVGVESCGQDFALVGQGFAFDENLEAERIGCKEVSVPGFVVSPAATHGPMTYQPVPNPVDVYGPGKEGVVVDNVEGADTIGIVGRDNNAAELSSKKTIAAYESLGSSIVDCGVVVKSAGGDNYRALVQRFRDCGATMLIDTATPSPPMYAFMDALKTEGFEGQLAFGTPWYADQVRLANANGLTEGLYVGMAFQPFENADDVQAVADYLAIMAQDEEYEAGQLGMQAMSAFLLWATAAKNCGSDLTRQCLVNELSAVHSWTGGGLHAESDPGANLPPSCAILTQVKGDGFVQVSPETPGEYDCYDQIDLPEANWGVELNADRLATTYLTDDILTPES